MPQPQRPPSVAPFVAIQRPACPRCKAAMMLASIEPAHPGVDLHTFECAICNHVLKSLAAYADPMKSEGLGRWLKAICTPHVRDTGEPPAIISKSQPIGGERQHGFWFHETETRIGR